MRSFDDGLRGGFQQAREETMATLVESFNHHIETGSRGTTTLLK